ncbi:hypothetical protein [Rhizobium rhizophilum]|uniref:Uncharacterized protein n=1 Tax=Rhizobium rhizophilum TaxID=1850373 RepID=A0ABY2QNR4_9HYPH|nr:hypothetical protein [Rhizobium rhizophilum]THV10974.1 hypothetical protein E9677_21700 [Rhizobium rhizophilum]
MKSLSPLIALGIFLASVAPLFAASDVKAPVREIIEAAARGWDDKIDEPSEDVFSVDRLSRLFSRDFALAFEAASKNPPFDPPEGETTGYPFDYDPIAQGQDGCPFEDIRIEDDGDGQVTALFNNRRCFGEGAEYEADTVLIFHVVDEAGRAVIDDIYPVVDGQSGSSIKQDLKMQGGL